VPRAFVEHLTETLFMHPEWIKSSLNQFCELRIAAFSEVVRQEGFKESFKYHSDE
jgi:hypothetical protein